MLEIRIIIMCLPTFLFGTTLEPDYHKSLSSSSAMINYDLDWQQQRATFIKQQSGGKPTMSGSMADDALATNNAAVSATTAEITSNPVFEESELMAHNATVQLGGTAFLVCKVAGIDRNQITWIRRRDWHILSSGDQMYTNDERFGIIHTPGTNTWTLQIKFVQRRDHGMYECQVATSTGAISHFVNLQVVVPEAFILGSGELHVDMGSTINLVCIIEKSPTAPQYVFWQLNNRMINYDETRRDITIETTPGPRTQSRLIIREPQISDSGNYTCSASNTEPASIYVFVSKGDNMAAISRRKSSSASRISVIICNLFYPSIIFLCLYSRQIMCRT